MRTRGRSIPACPSTGQEAGRPQDSALRLATVPTAHRVRAPGGASGAGGDCRGSVECHRAQRAPDDRGSAQSAERDVPGWRFSELSVRSTTGGTEWANQRPPSREPVENAATAPKRQIALHRRRIGLFLLVVDVMLSRPLTHSSPCGVAKLCENRLNLRT